MAFREHFATHVASEVTTTSSSTWTNAATLNFTPANGRDFVLMWSLELAQQSSTASDAKYRILLDGAAVASSNIESRATAEYAAFCGFFKLAGLGAARSVMVEIQSETSGQTTAIRNVSLIALALGADDHFAESLGRTDVTTGGSSWTDLVSMGWTPASAGDYLFLSSSLVDNFAATAPAYGRFDIGWTSPEWPVGVAEIASGQMNYVALGAAWVDGVAGGSPVTVKWQGRSLNNGNNSGWTDCRLLALRIDAFERAASMALSSDSSATSASLGAAFALTDAVSANPQLVVGAWSSASPAVNILGQVQVSDSLGAISNSYRRSFAAAEGRGTSSGFFALRQGYVPGSQSWTLSRASDGTNSYTVRGGAMLAVLDLGAAGRSLPAATGALSTTGRAATRRGARRLAAGVRSHVAATINGAIRRGFRLRADPRAYAATGQSAGLARGIKFRSTGLAVEVAGPAAGMIRTAAGRAVKVVTGTFSLTDRAVPNRTTRSLLAAVDNVTWSRLDAALRRSRRGGVGPGVVNVEGRTIGWDWIHVMRPRTAFCGLTTAPARFRHSGRDGWRPVLSVVETWDVAEDLNPAWSEIGGASEAWS